MCIRLDDTKIFEVHSYHIEYVWETDANQIVKTLRCIPSPRWTRSWDNSWSKGLSQSKPVRNHKSQDVTRCHKLSPQWSFVSFWRYGITKKFLEVKWPSFGDGFHIPGQQLLWSTSLAQFWALALPIVDTATRLLRPLRKKQNCHFCTCSKPYAILWHSVQRNLANHNSARTPTKVKVCRTVTDFYQTWSVPKLTMLTMLTSAFRLICCTHTITHRIATATVGVDHYKYIICAVQLGTLTLSSRRKVNNSWHFIRVLHWQVLASLHHVACWCPRFVRWAALYVKCC